MAVWLMRHGTSLSNAGGATSDSWAIPLTPDGEEEARRAAQHWADLRRGEAPFKVVTSPMLRARRTTEFILALHPELGAEVMEDLREFDPFDFSHLPPMRPEERRPLMESYWAVCDPTAIGCGLRAESFLAFEQRVYKAISRLRAEPSDVLAICHGGVIKLARLLQDRDAERLTKSELMWVWLYMPTIGNCGLLQLADTA